MTRLTEEECLEFRKKYPDVKIEAHDCEWTKDDHEIAFKAEQQIKEYEKNGTIRVSYTLVERTPSESTDIADRIDYKYKTKIFHWFNGKEWVDL